MELSTFSFLKDCETQAIPKRLQSISEDVDRQTEREKKLQDTFSQAQYQLQLQVLQWTLFISGLLCFVTVHLMHIVLSRTYSSNVYDFKLDPMYPFFMRTEKSYCNVV